MIERWSTSGARGHMDEEILLGLAPVVARHPWWRARAALTLGLLDRLGARPPARVLDAGCGWGVTLRALEHRGHAAVGLDISRKMLERLDRERPGRMLVEADLTRPPPEDAPRFDVVLALDVIEHLDDDRTAVGWLARLVRPGGHLIASVPALPEMFSEFDAIQGHRRRYRPEGLRAAFAGAGLEPPTTFWWGRWLVPALRRQRARPKSRPGETAAEVYRRYLRLPPWPAPWAARAAFALEHRAALEGRASLGTSLFAVARRPSSDGVQTPDDR